MSLAVACRCGDDLMVRAEGALWCLHCDAPCVETGCTRCSRMRRTCNDCRRTHATEAARARCEASHLP